MAQPLVCYFSKGRYQTCLARNPKNVFLFKINNKQFPSVYDGHKGKELPISVAQLVDGKWQKRKDNTG